MKSNRIIRIVKILTTLQAGNAYTADELSGIFGTSRRTIFRDLKQLQAIGVPYRYDKLRGGYCIDPEFFLPPLDLNLPEALSLLLLAQKARKQIQLPFKTSALLAAMKIENNLPAQIRDYCNIAISKISTKAGPQAPAPQLDKTFSTFQKALAGRKKIRLCYHSLYEDNDIELTLSPYHLMYNHRAWYVIGHSAMHDSVRTFKLNRIINAELLDKCFIDGDKFDIDDYLGKAWSMIPEGRLYNVKLRFLPKVARNVTEVRWHSTQKHRFNPDGSATMHFRVDGLGEIIWWILGYADQVQVLAPKILRKRVLQKAQKIIDINSANSPVPS